MDAAPSFAEALASARVATARALAIFDALAPVEATALLGAWRGSEFPTGHPLDGVLPAFRWHGKRFDSLEDVHPLLFDTLGGRTVAVNPALVAPGLPLAMRFPALKSAAVGRVVAAALPLLATRRARARLRMTLHRGHVTATLVYDQLPILDVFRRVDGDTLLGLMDRKDMAQPYFFVLRRESAQA